MNDLATTLKTVEQLGWTIVLLEPGTKRLVLGRTWEECQTRSAPQIRYHLRRSGGIGLDVAKSRVVVLDFDRPFDVLLHQVGPIPAPTTTSPSGGFHVYCTLPEGLDAQRLSPAILGKNGERYGEVIRGPHQQVVMPPSPYPGNEKRGVPRGGTYQWLVDPMDQIYILPPWWVAHLTSNMLPDFVERDSSDTGQPTWEDPWTGPEPEVLLTAAARQPGARRRAGKVKFQCPECAREGHDKHRDNAVVFDNGRWACAYAPGDADHRNAIGKALGFQHGVSEELADRHVSDDVAREIRRKLGL